MSVVEMFLVWLEKYSNDATWLRFIQALREVNLKTLADKIEGMLQPTEETIPHTNAGSLHILIPTIYRHLRK